MPTGYTAKLCDGEQTFKDFAMQCARAFGPLVEMREDPSESWQATYSCHPNSCPYISSIDAPIPEKTKRSSYYDEALSKTVAEYDRLKTMLPGKALAYGKACFNERIKRLQGRLEKSQSTRDRILKMIAQVEAWPVPTDEHNPLKAFMLEQLTTTLENDGDTDYYEKEIAKAKTLNPLDYYQAFLSSAARDIARYKQEAQKEMELNASRNAWLKALRQSLNGHKL